MRLVLREFISMLRESGELDALLVDLLLAMNIQPFSKPKKGTRQYGVDIAAVGPDEENGGSRTLFLLTVKRGDIGRSDWDGTPQAVRPSLSEILDVYIPSHIENAHKGLPIKVLVCAGGDFKQGVQLSWAQFTQHCSMGGGLGFDFWGADKLTSLVEKHLLDEHLFKEEDRKRMRRTLALVDLNEYDLRDYYEFLEGKLVRAGPSQERPPSVDKERLKALRAIHLSLRILFHWARDADNLRQAYIAAERTVLCIWDRLRLDGRVADGALFGEFLKIHETFGLVAGALYKKLQPYFSVRDSLWGYGANEVEYPIRTFEIIGFLGLWGMYQVSLPAGSKHTHLQEEAAELAHGLAELIKNNPAALSPCYDGHAIDIGLGLLLLFHMNRCDDARAWITQLVRRIFFAYRSGRHFPIATDSFDDLLDVEAGEQESGERLMDISTLVPMLAEWCAILDLPELYSEIVQETRETVAKTTLQLWYPDRDTEDHLYKTNASLESGSSEAPIKLPEGLDALRDRIRRVREHVLDPGRLSFFEQGLSVYGLIASRHFRTPLMPYYWQRLVTG